MSASNANTNDSDIQEIHRALASFKQSHADARIDVYRHAAWAIRIRIIERGFNDIARADREESVWSLLEHLPERIKDSITMLLLLTPQEARFSLANLEFEQPTMSRL